MSDFSLDDQFVVSATHASRRIPDGAVVTVDGAMGTVTIDSVPG